MPSKTDIANSALDKIGQTPIADITSTASSKERALLRNFESAVREAGERMPWTCLTKFADLVQSGTAPFKWGYSFSKPANFLRVNRFNQITIDHQVNDHFQCVDRFILTDADTAQIEYNEYNDNTGLYTPLFVEAIAWSLAAKVAPTILGGAGDIPTLMQGFESAIGRAATVDGHQREDINVINQVIQGSRLVSARRFSTNG